MKVCWSSSTYQVHQQRWYILTKLRAVKSRKTAVIVSYSWKLLILCYLWSKEIVDISDHPWSNFNAASDIISFNHTDLLRTCCANTPHVQYELWFMPWRWSSMYFLEMLRNTYQADLWLKRLITTEARVWFQANRCWIYGGHSATATCFSSSISVLPSYCHSTPDPYSLQLYCLSSRLRVQ